ncbi:MAG: ABC transporter ATP-binding protein [Actinomycetota bacterium]|nr:ABC transporter ATP-binding protein [Actinomycetota bacterium]
MSQVKVDHLDEKLGGSGLSPLDASRQPLLSIKDMTVEYRGRSGSAKAVDRASLDIYPQEVVGLAGESGSGKSTLAYAACRLLRPPAVITGGSTLYSGGDFSRSPRDIFKMSDDELTSLRWKEISIVFQSAMNSLNPVMKIGVQLRDAIDVHLSLSKSEADAKVEEVLDMVGIPRDRARSYPHQLSGGMRQRVIIAMALVANPKLIIMDEPTTALDVVLQREILSQIVELKQRLGFAVLFITHDLSLMMELTDRLAIMYAGRIVEIGDTKALRSRPLHPYTRGLLASFPSIRGARRELSGIKGAPPSPLETIDGCPFAPRCQFARESCGQVSMQLESLDRIDLDHLSACPFEVGQVAGIDQGVGGGGIDE